MKSIKRYICVIVVLIVFCYGLEYAFAWDNIPREVRIGLFFSHEQRKIEKAVSYFGIGAESGIQVGSLENNSTKVLFSNDTQYSLFIRKDAYFIKQNTLYTEYDPSQQADIQGEIIGPFHVQIGGNYQDFASANTKAQEIKGKGVLAYPVYCGVWQVWTGFYTSQNDAQFDITGNITNKLGQGTYDVVNSSENRIVIMSNREDVVMLYASDTGTLQILPDSSNEPLATIVDGVKYRGTIEIRRLKESDMTVINVLPLEEYLYGVIPCEIYSNSHPEALKAQAVASRTYVVKNYNKYVSLGFNMCNTVYSQVYRGFSVEKATANKAVDDTRGKIVMYEQNPASVYYFSSSGGMTEDCRNVWSGSYPYLVNVEDAYEKGTSWNYTWQTAFSDEEVKAILEGKEYNSGDILGINITDRSIAGRAVRVEIIGSLESIVFEKEKCRTMLDSLHSQWYDISTDSDVSVLGNPENRIIQPGGQKVMTSQGLKTITSEPGRNITIIGANNNKRTVTVVPKTYIFTGKGWGHAVGMSQEGAKGMAEAGFTYEEILMHYFPGTRIE
jgi:stage II sporulation protein D